VERRAEGFDPSDIFNYGLTWFTFNDVAREFLWRALPLPPGRVLLQLEHFSNNIVYHRTSLGMLMSLAKHSAWHAQDWAARADDYFALCATDAMYIAEVIQGAIASCVWHDALEFVIYRIPTGITWVIQFLAEHTRLLFGAVFVYAITGVDAVTCHTCFDQIAGCTGGANCLMLTQTAANTLSMAGTVVAVITCVSLLPPICLRVLSRSVLDCLKSVASRPAPGAPLDIEALGLPELVQAARMARCSYEDASVEVTRRLGAATTGPEINRLTAIGDQLQHLSTLGSVMPASGVDSSGLLMGAKSFAYAQATRVVRLARDRSTAMAGTLDQVSESPQAKLLKAKILRPVSMEEFSEMLNIFIMICHATGLVNCLVLTEFLRVVVYDTISVQKNHWTVAHELMLAYFEELETTSDDTLTLVNILQRGSLDTFLRRAENRAAAEFPRIFRQRGSHVPPGGGDQVTFTGKFSKSESAKPCISFNLGKLHPQGSLDEKGACKFRHVCDHFVNNKGPKGICGSIAHPRTRCDNPAKCDKPLA
jgi:hypothetical protein